MKSGLNSGIDTVQPAVALEGSTELVTQLDAL